MSEITAVMAALEEVRFTGSVLGDCSSSAHGDAHGILTALFDEGMAACKSAQLGRAYSGVRLSMIASILKRAEIMK